MHRGRRKTFECEEKTLHGRVAEDMSPPFRAPLVLQNERHCFSCGSARNLIHSFDLDLHRCRSMLAKCGVQLLRHNRRVAIAGEADQQEAQSFTLGLDLPRAHREAVQDAGYGGKVNRYRPACPASHANQLLRFPPD